MRKIFEEMKQGIYPTFIPYHLIPVIWHCDNWEAACNVVEGGFLYASHSAN